MAKIAIKAHIAGNLWKLMVQEGQSVALEETLVIMESMKMEIPVESPVAGVVQKIQFSEGATLNVGDVIMILEEKQ